MQELLRKMEEKLRTIIRLRLKIEISSDLQPEEMKIFTESESEYLDHNVEDILQDIDDVLETYKYDICSIVSQDTDDEADDMEQKQFWK